MFYFFEVFSMETVKNEITKWSSEGRISQMQCNISQ